MLLLTPPAYTAVHCVRHPGTASHRHLSGVGLARFERATSRPPAGRATKLRHNPMRPGRGTSPRSSGPSAPGRLCSGPWMPARYCLCFRGLALWPRSHLACDDPRIERESPLLRAAAPSCLLLASRVLDVGTQGIEPHLPAPRAGALTITRYPGAKRLMPVYRLARRAFLREHTHFSPGPGTHWPPRLPITPGRLAEGRSRHLTER